MRKNDKNAETNNRETATVKNVRVVHMPITNSSRLVQESVNFKSFSYEASAPKTRRAKRS